MTQPTVLVIEDERWLAENTQRVLQTAGFTVHTAPHAVAAIDMIDEFSPDVLVVDILLSLTTGFTLLHELQSHSDTAQVPVVLCSTIASSFTLADVAPYGVRRILDKATMTPESLVAAVRSVVA